jgi:hypothetical protein
LTIPCSEKFLPAATNCVSRLSLLISEAFAIALIVTERKMKLIPGNEVVSMARVSPEGLKPPPDLG